MRYLLDTNIVSYYLRRVSPVFEQRVGEALNHHQVAISVISRAEMRFGQAGMTADHRRCSLINSFLLRLPSLEWTVQATGHYGTLKNSLKSQARPIGEMDTQIAAHALAENLILVTHNTPL